MRETISNQETEISIHAPRTGSDQQKRQRPAEPAISIHAPRTGSDAPRPALAIPTKKFQSTLPARGATSGQQSQQSAPAISIHAPRTGSDASTICARRKARYFNPRSPHGERRTATGAERFQIKFQSTLPARGATRAATTRRPTRTLISIHAPRTGSDVVADVDGAHTVRFQSTLPARGATPVAAHQRVALLISIHAPRTGSDRAK